MSKRRADTPATTPTKDHGRWLVAAYLVLLPLAFVGRGLLTERVTAPLDALLVVDPWRISAERVFPEFESVHAPLMDCVTQYYPWRTYAKEALAEGELPLWDPYAFCGYPFIANNQSAVFYPPNLVFWVLPLGVAYDLSAYLALLLAGVFTYGLARDVGASRVGGALAAAGFVASGYLTVWLCYMGPVNSFLWTPLALWMLRRHHRDGGWLPLAGLGFAVCMAWLGGHAQAALYSLGATVAYAVYLHVAERRRATGPPLHAAGAVGLGLAASMIQLLPTLELAQQNYRTLAGTTPPRGLALSQLNILVAPQAHGHLNWWNDYGFVFGFHNYVETCGYVAIGLVWLAAAALLVGQGRDRWLLMGLAAGGLVLALEGPHQAALRAIVPSARQMPNVGRALCLYGLAVPLLAGMGYDALRAMDWADERRRSRLVAGGLIALMVAALALSVSFSRAGAVATEAGADLPEGYMAPIYRSLWWAVALVALTAGVTLLVRKTTGRGLGVAVMVLVLADVLVFAGNFQPAANPKILEYEPPTFRDLRRETGQSYRMLALPPPPGEPPMAYLNPNLPTLAGLRDADGYESLYPVQSYRLLRELKEGAPSQRRHALDRLGVRAVFSRGDPTPDYGPLELARSLFLFRNDAAWPIAFATDSDLLPSLAPLPAEVEWRANARRVRAEAGQHAWLTETGFPGWRAYADGVRADLERPSAYHWRVEAGRATDLVYEPSSFGVGGFVSLMVALTAGGGMGYLVVRRRTGRAATPEQAGGQDA
ncbi:MAG: hypothetical protein GF320_21220 [Armatimonadia bacterium]|nr:hypothetical protein [Armatimonadia bacterium]